MKQCLVNDLLQSTKGKREEGVGAGNARYGR